MSKSRGLSGGGIEGAKVKHAKAPKVEPKPRAINPGYTSQLGEHVGNRKAVTPISPGKGYKTPVGPSPSMGQGPGANRTIHHCGSQGTHGAPVQGPTRPAGDILGGFGPERTKG